MKSFLVQTPRHEMTGCITVNLERLIFIKPLHTQSKMYVALRGFTSSSIRLFSYKYHTHTKGSSNPCALSECLRRTGQDDAM